MRSAFRLTYGQPVVLAITEVEKPAHTDDELLIRVHAATVNRTDFHLLTGRPYMIRLAAGLVKPKLAVTGTDFAGEIEAAGRKVMGFKEGDRVVGFNFSGLRSHAAYLTINASAGIVRIADHVSYQDAVSCVEGAYYALNVIRKMDPQKGQSALVIGGTGAIGSSMVQLFAYYGASVTAVCAGDKAGLVDSLGAARIIDYQSEDFRKIQDRFDFIFDGTDKSSFGSCRHLLKKNGLYSSSRVPNLFHVFITPLFDTRREIFCPPQNQVESLSFLQDLLARRHFKPVIDRSYSLEEIAAAFSYVGSGQKTGNVILRLPEL